MNRSPAPSMKRDVYLLPAILALVIAAFVLLNWGVFGVPLRQTLMEVGTSVAVLVFGMAVMGVIGIGALTIGAVIALPLRLAGSVFRSSWRR